MGKVQ
jgi:hypothetical protein